MIRHQGFQAFTAHILANVANVPTQAKVPTTPPQTVASRLNLGW